MGLARNTLNKILRPLDYQIARVGRYKVGGPDEGSTQLHSYPTPDAHLVEKARLNFANEFDLSPQCPFSREEILQKKSEFFWHFPFLIRPDIMIEWDYKRKQGLKGYHTQRYNHFFPSLLSLAGGSLEKKSVLDCACNCGFWSIQAVCNGAESVLGFDASQENIEQAEFLKSVIGQERTEFKQFDFMNLEPETFGRHDIVFFLGILYHLNRPIEALARLKAVTEGFAVIDSLLDSSEGSILTLRTDNVHEQNHSNEVCMRPSHQAVVDMLIHVGFKKVWVVPNSSADLPTEYLTGRQKTYLAEV